MSSGMQAAFYIREKQKLRLKNNGSAAGLPPGITAAQLRRLGRVDRLPSNVATRDIAPFPTFPPNTWVRFVNSTPKYGNTFHTTQG